MISPSKKVESPGHALLKSSSPSNTKTFASKGLNQLSRKTKCNKFANKVLYLDLKSRKESTNLETALKTLGAVVAVFLDRNVTHVVSDRVFVSPDGSSSVASPAASAASISPLLLNSPNTSERVSFPRSRGTAMLERVSPYSSTGYVDPVTLAQQWRIPVLSAAKLWLEISRLEATQLAQRKTSSKLSSSSAKAKGDFIKVESLSGCWKPDLLKLEQWPVLDLENGAGPFIWAENGMTSTQTKVTAVSVITPSSAVTTCKMTRRPLKSTLNSEDNAGGAVTNKSTSFHNGHVSKNSSQEDLKVQCNGLIGGLRSSKLLSPSGSDVLPLPAQRRSTRRTSASWCGSTRELSQLSPPISPSSPSESLWIPVPLIGTTAEEHANGIRRRRGGSDTSAHSSDTLGKNRRKKLSPEEKLLQDNKDYFKMEVLDTKLRSSGPKHPPVNKIVLKKVASPPRKSGWKSNAKKNIVVDYEALIVESKLVKMNGVSKPKRPRRSALMNLCDEAESFMFGESSRQSAQSVPDEDDEEEEVVEASPIKEEPPTPELVSPRRKRRSHTEAFIQDNLDYYKFEPTGRLRSQGSVGGDSESDFNKDCNSLMFSFQAVPNTEPWFEVFRRQDTNSEMILPVVSDRANQLFLLPYELPRLPPRSETAAIANNYYFKRRQRLAQIITQSLPRKSPRCHASTLAILSSLKRKKRRSSASAGASDPDTTLHHINHGNPVFPCLDGDDSIEEIAMVDPVDSDSPAARRKKTEPRCSLKHAEAVPIAPEPPDLAHILTNCVHDEAIAPIPSTSRTSKKKRKVRVNRTGWDKVKTRSRKKRKTSDGATITSDNIMKSPRRSPGRASLSIPVSPCVVSVRKLSSSYCRKLVLNRRRRRSAPNRSWRTRKR